MDRNDQLRAIAALKDKLQPVLNQWHDLKAKAVDEKGEPRAFTADEAETHNQLAADISTLHNELEGNQRALKALDACTADDDRTASALDLKGGRNQLPHATDEYSEAFHASLSAGFSDPALNSRAQSLVGDFQALTGTSPSTGSVLVPAELEQQIHAEAAVDSALLSVSDVVMMGMRAKNIPFISDIGLLAPRAEGEEYVKSEPTITQKSLTVHNFGGLFPISNELMDDVPALEAEFARLAGRAEAETVEEYGLKGESGEADFTDLAGDPTTLTITGKTPTGILAYAAADVPEVTAAAKTAIAWTDLTALMQGVKSSAKIGGVFVLSKEAETEAMNMADDQNRPIWMAAMIAGQPSTIAGKPYYVSSRLDALGVLDNVPALFGNFNRGHRIGLRKGITVRKSEHFYFSSNMTAVAIDLRFAATVVYKEFIAKLALPA